MPSTTTPLPDVNETSKPNHEINFAASFPYDLLRKIFLVAMDRPPVIFGKLTPFRDYSISNWHLSHVCGNWRAAAISTAVLWSYIDFSYPPEAVKTMIERSGDTMPLCVQANVRGWQADTIEDSMNILKPVLHRIIVLQIRLHQHPHHSPFWTHLAKLHNDNNPLEVLEYLAVEVETLAPRQRNDFRAGYDALPYPPMSLDGQLLALRKLYVSGIDLPEGLVALRTGQLTHLLISSATWGRETTEEWVLDLVKSSRRLRHLSLSPKWDARTRPFDPIAIDNLEKKKRVHLPHLEMLELRFGQRPHAYVLRSLNVNARISLSAWNWQTFHSFTAEALAHLRAFTSVQGVVLCREANTSRDGNSTRILGFSSSPHKCAQPNAPQSARVDIDPNDLDALRLSTGSEVKVDITNRVRLRETAVLIGKFFRLEEIQSLTIVDNDKPWDNEGWAHFCVQSLPSFSGLRELQIQVTHALFPLSPFFERLNDPLTLPLVRRIVVKQGGELWLEFDVRDILKCIQARSGGGQPLTELCINCPRYLFTAAKVEMTPEQAETIVFLT